MKALLAQLSPQKAIGVFVGEQHLTVSRVAATPMGPVVLECHRQAYEAEQLASTLREILSAGQGRRRIPVGIGIASQRVFFATRPIRAASIAASPDVLLHEMLQSPSVTIDDMAVDVIQAQPGKRPVAAVASCRKKYLTAILAGLEGLRLRLCFVEPGPCALLRAAASQYRTPFRTKTVARVFLGKDQGLAVAVTGGMPVVWRTIVLKQGTEAAGLCSIVRRLEVVLSYCGVDGAIDAVLIHGRPDLRERIEAEVIEQSIGTRVQWHDKPSLDDEAIAAGLALGCFTGAASFDLARTMKPPPTLRDILPQGELAVQTALVLCMGLFLNFTAQSHHQAGQTVAAECSKHGWLAGQTDAALAKQKADLANRLQAVDRFMDSRVCWTRYLDDLARSLPASTRMDSFRGFAELAASSGKGNKNAAPSKRYLVVQASAPMKGDGALPTDIEGVVKALRGQSKQRGDFPMLSPPDIHLVPAGNGQVARAAVTVVCLPKGTAPGAGPDVRTPKAR